MKSFKRLLTVCAVTLGVLAVPALAQAYSPSNCGAGDQNCYSYGTLRAGGITWGVEAVSPNPSMSIYGIGQFGGYSVCGLYTWYECASYSNAGQTSHDGAAQWMYENSCVQEDVNGSWGTVTCGYFPAYGQQHQVTSGQSPYNVWEASPVIVMACNTPYRTYTNVGVSNTSNRGGSWTYLSVYSPTVTFDSYCT